MLLASTATQCMCRPAVPRRNVMSQLHPPSRSDMHVSIHHHTCQHPSSHMSASIITHVSLHHHTIKHRHVFVSECSVPWRCRWCEHGHRISCNEGKYRRPPITSTGVVYHSSTSNQPSITHPSADARRCMQTTCPANDVISFMFTSSVTSACVSSAMTCTLVLEKASTRTASPSSANRQ